MSSLKMLFLLVAVVFNSSTSKGNDFNSPLNLKGGDLSQQPDIVQIKSNPPDISKTSTAAEAPPTVTTNAPDTNSPAADATGVIAGSAENAKIVAANGPTGLESLAGLCAGLSSPIGQTLKPFCASLQASAIACTGKYATTSSTCNTETSPSLLTSVSQIQGLMGVAQGITNSCSVFSKAMNIAKLGMAAYTTTCGVLQKACDISCSKSSAELTKFQAETTALQAKLTTCANTPNNPTAPLCAEDLMFLQGNIDALVKKELAPTGTTVVAKASVCKIDVASLLGMSIINLGALAQSKAMSDQCKKDTTAQNSPVDCTKDENKEKTECKTASTVVDCGLTANADKPVCICKANPRLKGCEGISTSFATNSTLSTGGSGSTSGKGLSAGINNGTDAAINKQFPSDLAKTNKNDGTSSGFGSGGGSSAGLTGSSDGSASGNEAQIAKNNLANANILGGDSGGGGGGYRFNMGSSAAARNLARNIAATGAKGKLTAMDWSNQVTSNAGKSNFDKIKVRYNENRTSLLNK